MRFTPLSPNLSFWSKMAIFGQNQPFFRIFMDFLPSGQLAKKCSNLPFNDAKPLEGKNSLPWPDQALFWSKINSWPPRVKNRRKPLKISVFRAKYGKNWPENAKF